MGLFALTPCIGPSRDSRAGFHQICAAFPVSVGTVSPQYYPYFALGYQGKTKVTESG